ncbi:hypothetical protein DSO57_1032183 [Entomophthora muscae]|uniref:Uncharacterized protein n=1 Tax=Entomophthora muscae TaxID=34485 RepID=A0ACC2UAG0_9FUNG|nr:hypothetical protein DSO57_1032183 [Entomophthora muscae]
MILWPMLFVIIEAGESLEVFSPTPVYRKFTITNLTATSPLPHLAPLSIAHKFVQAKLGFSGKDYMVLSSHTSKSGTSHVYLRQRVYGREVFNADINLNIKNGGVVSYGDSFSRQARVSDGDLGQVTFPQMLPSAVEVMEKLLLLVGAGNVRIRPVGIINHTLRLEVAGALDLARVQLGWIQLGNGRLEPVWDIQVEFFGNYFNSHLSIVDHRLVAHINWVSHASYRVLPFPLADPREGERVLVTDPFDKTASPLGWHKTDSYDYLSTSGNNVVAVVENSMGNSLGPVEGGEGYMFDFPFFKDAPHKSYREASTTNVFYVINTIHDILYNYGFTERAGNFQQTNFARGGIGEDPVVAYVQSPVCPSGPVFTSPPDGYPGRLILCTSPDPTGKPFMVDGALDSGIIIHEYSHGLSNRLVGGPANAGCLSSGEPASLGEGWGDAIAIILRANATHTRLSNFALGSYVYSKIRPFQFSTSLPKNPITFSYLNLAKFKEPHYAGFLWASLLYEAYWNLRDKLGFNENWIRDTKLNYGNTLMLQIIIDSMSLLPCSPTFIQARDATLIAESSLTQGKHACDLWSAFAKRGMGHLAVVDPSQPNHAHIASFDVPEKCLPPPPPIKY